MREPTHSFKRLINLKGEQRDLIAGYLRNRCHSKIGYLESMYETR
jgi:hypothetical protein